MEELNIVTQGFTWHAADTEPSNPNIGDVYFDSPTGGIKVYDGTVWQLLSLEVGITEEDRIEQERNTLKEAGWSDVEIEILLTLSL